MNYFKSLRCCVLAAFVFIAPTLSYGQSWLELREQGANFNDIKAAFERQYGKKLKKMKRELLDEADKRVDAKSDKKDNFERQMEGMVQYMRWADFYEPRATESNGDLNAISSGMVQALANQSRANASTRTSANWSLIGPKNTPIYGGNGRINTVRGHPSVAGTIFACSPAGGLWKSTNSGGSWAAITDEIAVLGATDVAFDPQNAQIMYLATGDGEAGDAVSTGIYKSTNGGSTWAATGLTFTTDLKKKFSRLLVNPSDGSILAGGSAGIYRSTDKGATWTQTSSLTVRDLEFKPNNPSVVYAGGYNGTGFLRSIDGGLTWTAAASNGLPNTFQRIALAVTPLDSNYVYAMTAKSTDYSFGGLYLSTDGGTTFNLQSSAPNVLGWNADGGDSGGQGWYTLSLAVDPSVKSTIFVGGVNVWKSTTSGTSWTCAAHWYGGGAPYVHADIHDLTFVGSTLYAGHDGGISSSENGGRTWLDRSSNLSIAQIYSFGISQSNPNLIISGHQDNGTNLTSDRQTWFQVNSGDGMVCFIDRATASQYFSSIYFGRLYRSTNSAASAEIFTVPGGGWVTPWLQDPVDPATLYAGGNNVYQSVDAGTSWTAIASFSIGTIVSLDVAKSNNNYIVAASKTNVIKTNNVLDWTDITSGLPTGVSILNAYFDPTNPQKIYVGLASYTGQSVYFSANGGTSWTNISAGLPSVPANCFVQQIDNGDVYCGTDIGVYLRSVGSTTWVPFSAGMPGIPVKDLDIYVATGKLRAATYARGIWESDLNLLNKAPSVSLTSPTNNAVISSGFNVVINATAADSDGSIAKVEFYQGTTLLSTSTTAPYTYTWLNPAIGNYALTAKAYDNANAATTSTPVNISVVFANDIGISSVLWPSGTTALQTVTPSVILKNFGQNTLTATTISYKVDNTPFANYAWTGSLTAGATTTVALPAVTGYSVAAHNFTAQTGSINGNVDANALNNAAVSSFTLIVPQVCANSVNSPYNQNFNASTTTPTSWTNNYTWLFGTNHGNGVGNGMYKYVSAASANPQIDLLPIKVTSVNDQLSFDYRLLEYVNDANYPASANPIPAGWGEIQVQVSTNCGTSFTTIYAINDSNHVVSKNWATKTIPLSKFANQTIIIRFYVNISRGDGYSDFDNFIVSPSCSATPSAGTASVSLTSTCLGVPFTLSATGTSSTIGTTFQWQKSTDGLTWTNVNGATSPTVSTPVTSSGRYKLVTTCANNPTPASSNILTLTATTPTYAAVPYVQNFEAWATSSCVTSGITRDVPSVNWQNSPVSGVNSWRRDDQGFATAGWESQFGAYTPSAQSGTYSARFHTYRATAKGALDLFIDLGSPASKVLSFYYINPYGSDTMRVLLSTDGGQTFAQIGTTLRSVATWTLKTFNLPIATATSVIRFEGSGTNSSYDIGIDNLSVTPVTVVPDCISANVLPASGSKGICPNLGVVLSWEASANARSYDIFTNVPSLPSPINVVGTSYTLPSNLALNTDYTWKVVPKNSVGSAADCYIWSFTTNESACYCTPTYIDGCADTVDVITRLQLGTLDNVSGKICNPNNYTYYGAATIPSLPRDIPQYLRVTFGNDATQFAGAWIDYNQNGTFETSEYIGGNSVSPRNYGTSELAFSVPTTALMGETRLRVRGGEDTPLSSDQSCGASSNSYGETEDYRVNIVASTPCTGVSLTNVALCNLTTACVDEALELSLQNAYTLSGITYQWQISADGAAWTNIVGETKLTTVQAMSATNYYRCAIACSGGAPTYSAPVNVTLKGATDCYCRPIADCPTGFIDAVTISNTTFNNTSSGCSNAVGSPSSYIAYPSSRTTASLAKGSTYSLNVTTSFSQIISVWVDFNQNGAFEAAEWTQVAIASTANAAATAALAVPTTALTGVTLMRIRSRTAGSANGDSDACATFGSGETEDYSVTIAPAVIPLELTAINAYAVGETNKIDWSTVSEKALKSFVVERSTNNNQWFTVGTAAPKGGLNAAHYAVIDANPLPLSYYRVRTIESNGAEQLSKIVSVKRFDAKKLTLLSVAPVPSTEGVVVDFSIEKATDITLTLVNIMGQLVKQTTLKAVEGANKTTVDLSDLPNGTYLLTLSDGQSTELKRVVKQ